MRANQYFDLVSCGEGHGSDFEPKTQTLKFNKNFYFVFLLFDFFETMKL
jgi:hypothetical protein